ncbi:Dynein assembly factor 3, axonemal [Homalodisca vitripennis]|nr:Dynein assembly factor 3, axonemal [Homalodisca vitripennis]
MDMSKYLDNQSQKLTVTAKVFLTSRFSTVGEYKHWRATGVAFTWLETEVSEPNPTLASGIVKLGHRLLNHGYLGDIVSPPYLGFGTDSEDKDMLVARNGVNVHRSTDIVEANLRRMFHELATQTEFKQTTSSDKELGTVITELSAVQEIPEREEDVEEDAEKQEDFRRRDDYTCLPVEGTKVVFLPTSALLDLPRKPNLKNFFDLVMVSQNLTQRLSPEVMTMAKDGAILLAETRKFLTTSTNKEKQDFADHLKQLAEERQCKLLHPVDGVKDYLAKFKVVRKG